MSVRAGVNKSLISLVAICLSAVSGGIAAAADLLVKAPPLIPVYSWTGCYIGGNGGGGWTRKNATVTNETFSTGASVPTDIALGSLTADGAAYGGQIGCDYQINSSWVVGVRGMWDGTSMQGTSGTYDLFVPGETYTAKVNSFGTGTVRIGYVPIPTVMIYGLAGAAFARDTYALQNPDTTQLATGTQSRSGYDVGVGGSLMLAHSVDLWIEYDYMGFGTKSTTLAVDGTIGTTVPYVTANVSQNVSKVLVGVDYRFGGK
jgi:outer membrane immunogenic protein